MSHSVQIETLAADRRFVRLAWKFTKNTEDAEDVVQDALLSAWKHIGEFHGQSKLSTWFGSIVINTALMRLRGKKREFVEVTDWIVSPERSPESQAIAGSVLDKTIADMRRYLQPSQRAILALYSDGKKEREVALELGIAIGSVKAGISRGRARLRANA